MPKDRVCATDTVLPGITRRSLLAAPLALLPSNTSARTESPVMRLFHRHQRLREQFARACDLDDAAAEDAIFDRMVAAESEMMAMPSIGAADFAAKVIVDTNRGGLFSDWETGALWIEARELTGCGA